MFHACALMIHVFCVLLNAPKNIVKLEFRVKIPYFTSKFHSTWRQDNVASAASPPEAISASLVTMGRPTAWTPPA